MLDEINERAVEAALQIKEKEEAAGGAGTVTVLTVGPERATEAIRKALSMGADNAVHVKDVAELKSAMVKARQAQRTQVIVIDTTHTRTTDGGCWWEVAIPEVSVRPEVNAAHANHVVAQSGQRL